MIDEPSRAMHASRSSAWRWRAGALGVALCMTACSANDTTVTALLPATGAAQVSTDYVFANSSDQDLNPRLLRRFKPLAMLDEERPQKLVNLGRMLYFEPLLSTDGRVSCNSCHPLDRYGATRTAVSFGVNGKQGLRNAPSTYNASGQFRQFWDGRAANIVEQVKGPLLNPNEMGMTESLLIDRLNRIDGYRNAFEAAFPGSQHPVSMTHLSEAVAEFERGLLTPSRWDRYLAGDTRILTTQEKAGAKAFANLGCMVCHEGQFLGGSMFQKVGVMIPWPNQRDRGRGAISNSATDNMIFKVPSLRNVAMTSPYFHDGSVDNLTTAVQMMARHQLGVSLTDDEAESIVAWLGSLTGTIPENYIRPPELPAAARP